MDWGSPWRAFVAWRCWACGLTILGCALVSTGCLELDRTAAWENPAAIAGAFVSQQDVVQTRQIAEHAPQARGYTNPQAVIQTRLTHAPAQGQVTHAVAEEVTHLPPAEQHQIKIMPRPVPSTPTAAVPISMETVFRLAEEQNPQVSLARERVHEAHTEQDIAAARWLPSLYAGTAFYRHEGGIQDQDGTLVHSSSGALFPGFEIDGRFDLREFAYQRVSAERKVWQQRGELSRLSYETLLDAASTYVDLMTARTGEAIARLMETDLIELLDRAQKLAAKEAAFQVEVHRIQAELGARQQDILRLQEQANAASAKLAYLLGLDPCTKLIPIDEQIILLDLVDATPPACDLVTQALENGPGIQEMEGLLALIQESIDRAQGPGKWLPVFELRMAEGGFGAGPGDAMRWDNRWDLGLQVRWNLTEFCTLAERRRLAESKIQQAHLAYKDLRSKLTAGVQEARTTIINGKGQIRLGRQQIRDARAAFDISKQRLIGKPLEVPPSEVLLAIRAHAGAQLNYLTAVSSYDKAQLRLMVLLGPGAATGCKNPSDSAPHGTGVHMLPPVGTGRLPTPALDGTIAR